MILCRYKDVLNEPLVFAVEAAPPSAAAIEARATCLPIRALERTEIRLLAAIFGIPVGLFAGAALCALADVRWADQLATMAMLMMAVGLVVVVLVGHVVVELKMQARRQRKSLEPLEQSRCSELLAACAASPEVELYRQAVIAQGRTFVNAEFEALTQYAATAGQRAACKTLYAVPEESK